MSIAAWKEGASGRIGIVLGSAVAVFVTALGGPWLLSGYCGLLIARTVAEGRDFVTWWASSVGLFLLVAYLSTGLLLVAPGDVVEVVSRWSNDEALPKILPLVVVFAALSVAVPWRIGRIGGALRPSRILGFGAGTAGALVFSLGAKLGGLPQGWFVRGALVGGGFLVGVAGVKLAQMLRDLVRKRARADILNRRPMTAGDVETEGQEARIPDALGMAVATGADPRSRVPRLSPGLLGEELALSLSVEEVSGGAEGEVIRGEGISARLAGDGMEELLSDEDLGYVLAGLDDDDEDFAILQDLARRREAQRNLVGPKEIRQAVSGVSDAGRAAPKRIGGGYGGGAPALSMSDGEVGEERQRATFRAEACRLLALYRRLAERGELGERFETDVARIVKPEHVEALRRIEGGDALLDALGGVRDTTMAEVGDVEPLPLGMAEGVLAERGRPFPDAGEIEFLVRRLSEYALTSESRQRLAVVLSDALGRWDGAVGESDLPLAGSVVAAASADVLARWGIEGLDAALSRLAFFVRHRETAGCLERALLLARDGFRTTDDVRWMHERQRVVERIFATFPQYAAAGLLEAFTEARLSFGLGLESFVYEDRPREGVLDGGAADVARGRLLGLSLSAEEREAVAGVARLSVCLMLMEDELKEGGVEGDAVVLGEAISLLRRRAADAADRLSAASPATVRGALRGRGEEALALFDKMSALRSEGKPFEADRGRPMTDDVGEQRAVNEAR